LIITREESGRAAIKQLKIKKENGPTFANADPFKYV
jgi:hypothetical protein